MALDIILITIGMILLIAGLAGAVIPVLPGPPLSFLGFLLIHFSQRIDFSSQSLITFGALALFITVADYILPAWGTQKTKGSRHGVFGASIGLVIGMFFFPPVGIFIGPFAGAWLAEKVNGKNDKDALMSALGSFLGLMLGIVLKFLISLVMLAYAIRAFFI